MSTGHFSKLVNSGAWWKIVKIGGEKFWWKKFFAIEYLTEKNEERVETPFEKRIQTRLMCTVTIIHT